MGNRHKYGVWLCEPVAARKYSRVHLTRIELIVRSCTPDDYTYKTQTDTRASSEKVLTRQNYALCRPRESGLSKSNSRMRARLYDDNDNDDDEHDSPAIVCVVGRGGSHPWIDLWFNGFDTYKKK